jgi:hypothetical protein
MKEYTLTLVTYVPYTQTVTVTAENQDEALFAYGDLINEDAWVRDDTHVIEQDEVDVESISPEDEDSDNEDEE